MLIKELVQFGLTEKEAKVYLALLELEVATVNEIAKATELNRSSMYVILDALEKRGLVTVSGDKDVKQYVAASPELLLRNATELAKKYEDVRKNIELAVPELKALHKETKHKPKVQVFEGKDGLRNAYYDILSTNANTLKVYATPENIIKAVPDFMKQNIERIKKGIKMYAINPATKESVELLKHIPSSSPDEVLLIPKEKFRFSSDLAIYANKVGLASPKEKFAIIIESKEIADMMRESFNLSWEEAKRLDKKNSK